MMNSAKSNKSLLVIYFILTSVLLGLLCIITKPAQAAASCEDNAKYINARATSLSEYQKIETKSYIKNRKKWAERSVYASQWLKKEPKKAASSIQKYDKQYAELNEEVVKQIGEYTVYLTDPLSCNDDAAKARVDEKNVQVKADYETVKKKEKSVQKYYKDGLEKDLDKMMKKLNKAKRKHQKPNKQKITIPESSIKSQ